MTRLTAAERADVDEAMRAFPLLPAWLTVPLGRRLLGPAIRRARATAER